MYGIGYLSKALLSKFWQHRDEMNFCEWFWEHLWKYFDWTKIWEDIQRIEASHIRKAKSETVNLLPHIDFVIPKQPCLMFSINFPKVCIFGMFQSKIVIVYCIFSLQFWDLVWFEIGIVSYFQRVLNLAD